MLARQILKSGRPTLPTLVFLHGFLGSHQDFNRLASRLIQAECGRCVLFDLPGHGQSIALDANTYSFHGAAEAILQTIEHDGIHQPILYGYSMGGRLALYLALRWPDRFTAAFLESTSPGIEHPIQQLARRHQDEILADRIAEDFSTFLDRWYQADLFRSLKHHPQFPALLDRRRQNHPQELARSLRGLGTGVQPSLWSALTQAQIPLYLLAGTQDSKFCAINQRMQGLCPTAQLHLIPEVGHNLQVEAPDRLFQIVQSKLSMKNSL